MNEVSVRYMAYYLRFVVEFEKYNYVWTNSLNSLNYQINQLISQNQQLEQEREYYKSKLRLLGTNDSALSKKKIFKTSRQKSLENTLRRNRLIFEEKLGEAERQLNDNENAKFKLCVMRNEIVPHLQEARNTLAKIYSENILPYKYRNLSATVTLYEYLITRRCDKIAGDGGIYDTYEKECIQINQLVQLMQINGRLSRMEYMQRLIYRELCEANTTLNNIKASIPNIVSKLNNISHSEEVSACANKQSAEALKYMAWKNY